MKIELEFSGGLELLFDNKKSHTVELKGDSQPFTSVLLWIKENLVRERPELFLDGKNVRPGILVLINEIDIEIASSKGGQLEIEDGDSIVFISTLHGG